MKSFTAGPNENGVRLSRFVEGVTKDMPRSMMYKAFRNKRIKVNGKKGAPEDRIKAGDLIELYINDEFFPPEGAKPVHKPAPKKQQNQPKVTVIYEDENIAVLYKPTHLLCHSDRTGDANLVDAFAAYLEGKGEYDPHAEKRFAPALCNRLDRNTSGIVAAGKTLQGLQMLSGLFKERTLHKYYLCIVKGVIKEEQDVRGWLLKNEKTNQVRIFKNETKDARPIHTKYRPLADNGQETLLEIELLTGRTHQIRAHLSYMGHPIFGDPKYGDAVLNKKLTSGYGLHMQLLHAWHLVFPELSGDFEGLSGKSIYAPAPKQFVSIAQKRGLGTWEHGIPEV